jgi:TIR domain
MPNEVAAGFWSYAHDDNRLDGGAVLKLAGLIAEEFDLLSGEPLELFIDRASIAWGQEWRARIDAALSQTTFFIPIITPRYFARPECRRELLEFAAKAKSLGVEELLLPILYVGVESFSEENSDEAIALVAKTQYVDWRETRLLDSNSREYRTAVNGLARRLLEIAREVTAKQLDEEVKSDLDDDGTVGIADMVEEITRLLPEWLDAVMAEKFNDAQIDATFNQITGAVSRLRKSRASVSAVLGAQMRGAREVLPLFERKQKDARIYLTRSVELDPLISSLARQLSEHSDIFALAIPIREAIDEAMEVILGRNEDEKSFYGRRFAEWSHLGRIFQKCYAIARDFQQLIIEANSIVKRWDGELPTRNDVENDSFPGPQAPKALGSGRQV